MELQKNKNHYQMEQIADFIKQLYEYFYLKKNETKNISSELLASFLWKGCVLTLTLAN